MHPTSLKEGRASETNRFADRDKVAATLESEDLPILPWFDSMPPNEGFYKVLANRPESLQRVQQIVRDAPRLISDFKASLELTRLIASGDVERFDVRPTLIEQIPLDAPLPAVAEIHRFCSTATLTRWVLHPDFEIGQALTAQMDAVLKHCLKRLYIGFDVFASGSYGREELAPHSNVDLFFLSLKRREADETGLQAEFLLSLLANLKKLGGPIDVSVHWARGIANEVSVQTYDEFRAYDFDGMKMGERFSIGNSRQLQGSDEGTRTVLHSAYGLPLTPERLRDLVKIKRKLETERVMPQHRHRNIKNGTGGLADIEWFVHLHEMRFPESTRAGSTLDMAERIRTLARVRLINAIEAETLLEARTYLLALRTRIYLHGFPDDLMPENPDRLERLAHSSGLLGANELLAHHLHITETIRGLYLEALERLRA